MKTLMCSALAVGVTLFALMNSYARAETTLELLIKKSAVESSAESRSMTPAGSNHKATTATRSGVKQRGSAGFHEVGHRAGGSIQKQHSGVSIACLRPSLRRVLGSLSARFGSPVIVTSGFRSRAENRRAGGASQSYHMSCMAADIKIAGVSPGVIARYARTLPGVGGVGFHTYTSAVHIDVGPRVATWVHGGSRKRYAKRGGAKRYRVAAR